MEHAKVACPGQEIPSEEIYAKCVDKVHHCVF